MTREGHKPARAKPGSAFTGREWDPETGLYYYRARYYDPKLGRFISEDPIGFAGGDINLYGYVWNRPVGMTDPLGLWGIEVHDYATYAWARQTGFSEEDAAVIAYADQSVDEWANIDPYSGSRGDWHFPTEARVQELLYTAYRERSLWAFGQALHALQDSFAHQKCETHRDFSERYGETFGHLLAGTAPDNPEKRPAVFAQTRLETLRQMWAFRDHMYGRFGGRR